MNSLIRNINNITRSNKLQTEFYIDRKYLNFLHENKRKPQSKYAEIKIGTYDIVCNIKCHKLFLRGIFCFMYVIFMYLFVFNMFTM